MLGAAEDVNGRQERTSAKENAKKKSYSPLGVLGAAADGTAGQEQASSQEAATEVAVQFINI